MIKHVGDMSSVLTWFSANAVALGIIGSTLPFAWSVLQFVLVRRKEQRSHEFEAYHRLIKELVSPDSPSGNLWIDRQIAAVFELRHFPRYFEVTTRILVGLRDKWSADSQFRWPNLIREIDLTLEHILSKKPQYRAGVALSGSSVDRRSF